MTQTNQNFNGNKERIQKVAEERDWLVEIEGRVNKMKMSEMEMSKWPQDIELFSNFEQFVFPFATTISISHHTSNPTE